jgi:hypothetical protein
MGHNLLEKISIGTGFERRFILTQKKPKRIMDTFTRLQPGDMVSIFVERSGERCVCVLEDRHGTLRIKEEDGKTRTIPSSDAFYWRELTPDGYYARCYRWDGRRWKRGVPYMHKANEVWRWGYDPVEDAHEGP